MKQNNIPANLIEDLDIKEQRTSATWIRVIAYFAIGLAGTLALFFINDSKSSFYMFSAIAACVGYLLAICCIIFSRRNMLYNGKKVKGYTLFFDTTTANLQKAIDNMDTKAFKSYMNNNENGLKLEVAYTDDYSLARYCMYRYIPFEFQPDSEIINIKGEQVEFITKH